MNNLLQSIKVTSNQNLKLLNLNSSRVVKLKLIEFTAWFVYSKTIRPHLCCGLEETTTECNIFLEHYVDKDLVS